MRRIRSKRKRKRRSAGDPTGHVDDRAAIACAIEPPLIAIHLVASNEHTCSQDVAHRVETTRTKDDNKTGQQKRKPSAFIINDQNPASIGRVELVKRTFIGLIGYNKLRLTCLVGSICTGINLALIPLFTLAPSNEKTTSECKSLASDSADCRPSTVARFVHQYGSQLSPVKSQEAQLLLVLHILALACVSLALVFSSRAPQLSNNTHIQNSQCQNHKRSKFSRLMSRVHLKVMRLAMLLSLVMLQLIVHYSSVHNRVEQPAQAQSIASNRSQTLFASSFEICDLPISAPLALLYLTPIAVQSSSSVVEILGFIGPIRLTLCTLMTLRETSWGPSKLAPPVIANQHKFLLILLPIVFALGWSWRGNYKRLVSRNAFAGARRSIEAKVSLERQRQQQETLLLSVLPAYVAEQVKRNMLRRVESIQQQGDELASSAGLSSCVVSMREIGNAPVTELLASQHVIHRPNWLSLGASLERSPPSAQTTCEPHELANRNSSHGTHPTTPQSSCNHTASASFTSGPNLNTHPAHSSSNRRGLNDLHIRTYNSVSLLYADIVGFTKLCSELSSSQLVRILNTLFSYFDHLAERHKIMRIKILGDCYYGVSGIPNFAVLGAKSRQNKGQENHAINCVNMGLDMIDYIRRLNIELARKGVLTGKFELNMRIGIHSGHIHSGVIGLKKWQFDVWSNDVSIAMHCESSGTAGRVQVTQATIQYLQGAFSYEPSNAGQVDDFLSSNGIDTSLIIGRVSAANDQLAKPSPTEIESKFKPIDFSRPAMGSGEESDQNIRAATINTIRQTLLIGGEISLGADNQKNQKTRLNYSNLTGLLLRFRDPAMQKLYSNRALKVSRQQVAILWFLAAFLMPSTDIYLVSRSNTARYWTVWLIICSSLSSLAALILSRCRPDKGATRVGNVNLVSPNLHFIQLVIPTLKAINVNTAVRLLESFGSKTRASSAKVQLMALVLFGAIFGQLVYVWSQSIRKIELANCNLGQNSNLEAVILDHNIELQRLQLSALMTVIALNMGYNLLTYEVHLILLSFIICLHVSHLLLQPQMLERFLHKTKYCQEFSTLKLFLLDWSSWSIVLAVMLLSWLISRQLEFVNKVNFLWRNQLNVDHEELEYISGINKILLENILPSHVVQYYLSQSSAANNLGASTDSTTTDSSENFSDHSEDDHSECRGVESGRQTGRPTETSRMSFSSLRSLTDTEDLYHEQHTGVAVMFASIPHFHEFYDETDFSKRGLNCIALLNEIICDFDKLLSKNKFSRIEKIKTIGSTYMAVAGLRPHQACGRNSNASVSSEASDLTQQASDLELHNGTGNYNDIDTLGRFAANHQRQNLVCMVQFASNMMIALNSINKQSFQMFKLRVGLHTGDVIAGVIGAQRKFYDIWGDCVNIASRMESLGQVGRIQVEERTARLLMDTLLVESYSIEKRGLINVKGKGNMVTYFVDKRAAN